MIERAIEQANGVYTNAAKILGIHPTIFSGFPVRTPETLA